MGKGVMQCIGACMRTRDGVCWRLIPRLTDVFMLGFFFISLGRKYIARVLGHILKTLTPPDDHVVRQDMSSPIVSHFLFKTAYPKPK